jgi:hypothetical protein
VSRRSLIEPPEAADDPEMLVRRLELLLGVAKKALAMRKGAEAETLLASIVGDCHTFASRASTAEDIEYVARMHVLLAPLLPQLEALTGRGWTSVLGVVRLPPAQSRLPRRGRS